MKPRIKKIKRLDDRSLIGLNHTLQGRCADSLASAMKNVELDKRDMAMVHLLDVFDYLMEYKNTNHEVWKRYRKKKKEARAKAEKLKALWKNTAGWTFLDLNASTPDWWGTISATTDFQSLSESAKKGVEE
jgi:hypothetical protein